MKVEWSSMVWRFRYFASDLSTGRPAPVAAWKPEFAR